MRTVMNYQQIPFPFHVIQIENPTTGAHTTIVPNLKLRTSYSVATKCQPGILILFLASGLRLLLPTTTKHHFLKSQTCTTQLTKLLLAMSPGNHLHYNLMELDQQRRFHHGWMRTTMSGSGILAFSFTTSCPIPISKVKLISHPFKNTRPMERIDFKILCLGYGPGNKQRVFAVVF